MAETHAEFMAKVNALGEKVAEVCCGNTIEVVLNVAASMFAAAVRAKHGNHEPALVAAHEYIEQEWKMKGGLEYRWPVK